MIPQTRKNRPRPDLFRIIWRTITSSARGAWSESDLGRGKAKRFEDSDVVVVDEFAPPDGLHLLISLVLDCERLFGHKPCVSSYDRGELQQAIDWEPDYEPAKDLIRRITGDMMHVGSNKAVDVTLLRRFMTAIPAVKRSEIAHMQASEWLLFLNHDYRGGELLFPTREIAIKPQAGTIVRWPSGIPHAVALAHEGYQFALTGRSV